MGSFHGINFRGLIIMLSLKFHRLIFLWMHALTLVKTGPLEDFLLYGSLVENNITWHCYSEFLNHYYSSLWITASVAKMHSFITGCIVSPWGYEVDFFPLKSNSPGCFWASSSGVCYSVSAPPTQQCIPPSVHVYDDSPHWVPAHPLHSKLTYLILPLYLHWSVAISW